MEEVKQKISSDEYKKLRKEVNRKYLKDISLLALCIGILLLVTFIDQVFVEDEEMDLGTYVWFFVLIMGHVAILGFISTDSGFRKLHKPRLRDWLLSMILAIGISSVTLRLISDARTLFEAIILNTGLYIICWFYFAKWCFQEIRKHFRSRKNSDGPAG